MIGARLGPYEITDRIGSGGMGEVWRARDTRLGRDVAIKVLPAEFAADPDRLRRFEQEARAAAALNHSNILVLFDVGRHEGQPYLVTELLEGQTLTERIRAGNLTVARAVELGIQITKGLAAAHEKGIVHRDLKPGNVFVTRDGTVKILDFGLAKLTQPVSGTEGTGGAAASGTDTASGLAVGTVGYMAPEQIRLQPVDHRADIFAFGCVLYEMLSGRRAFRGETPADTMSAILSKDPEPLCGVIERLPAALDQIVRRCLEKRPADRFSSAHDVALALPAALSDEGRAAAAPVPRPRAKGATRRWQVGGVLGAMLVLGAVGAWLWRSRTPRAPADLDPMQVVVAVFENRTGDRSLDPLGRLAAESVAEGIARIPTLQVAFGQSLQDMIVTVPDSRSPGTKGDLAKATGAGVVVNGAYYLHGPELRIQATVTDAATGKQIYTIEPARAAVEAPLPAVEAARERVTDALAARYLHPFFDLLGWESQPPRFEAYREMLAAWEQWDDTPVAIQGFTKAAEIDPDFFFVRWLLINKYFYIDCMVAAELVAGLEEARPRLTPVYRRLLDFWQASNIIGRANAAREAARLAPESVFLAHLEATTAWRANQPRQALAALARPLRWEAMASQSCSWGWYYFMELTGSLHALGQHERELMEARRGRAVYPDVFAVYGFEARAQAALGRLDEVREVVDDALMRASRGGTFQPMAAATAGEFMLVTAAELRAHGHRGASIALAERAVGWYRARESTDTERKVSLFGLGVAQLLGENWEEAQSAFAQLAANQPPDIRVERYLATLAARRGDRGEAGRIGRELAQLDRPCLRGEHTYVRACIAAQLGDKDSATALLREALSQDYWGFEPLQRDIDLEPLWDFPPCLELMRPVG